MFWTFTGSGRVCLLNSYGTFRPIDCMSFGLVAVPVFIGNGSLSEDAVPVRFSFVGNKRQIF
jgi:hypothetical protein